MPKQRSTDRRSDKLPAVEGEIVSSQITLESTLYMQGIFDAFREKKKEYVGLTAHLHQIEGQIDLAEKTLSLTRDYLAMAVKQTKHAAPHDWDTVLKSVRFVGVRLADACAVLLQESSSKKLMPEKLLEGLNDGMFRFRTNSPLREIHAALLKQASVKRVGQQWTWVGNSEQLPLRLRVVRPAVVKSEEKEVAS